MFALIFMWTPPHFWALALFVKSITAMRVCQC
jgi:protoheme IX farnesyltransferase